MSRPASQDQRPAPTPAGENPDGAPGARPEAVGAHPAAPAMDKLERELGAHGERGTGPLLIVLAGVHGNEPGGVVAVQRVLARLQAEQPAIAGRVVAFAGNLAALRHGVRYLESDLNRIWSPESIGVLLGQAPEADSPEQREQRELFRCIALELVSPARRVVLLDLHSTSAWGPPFALMSDTLENRRVSDPLPIPVILGLEETVSNTTLEYFGERGCVSLGVEGGGHDDPTTADNHEAVLWLTLVSTGLLQRWQVPDHDALHQRLQKAAKSRPDLVEIVHRHGIPEGADFKMEPGFTNFDAIKAGQLLARQDGVELRATADGRVIMPSYQGLGDDGYFEGKEIASVWFMLSGWLRHWRLGRFLHWLPGVSHHPSRPNALLVDRRIARWKVVDVFHLFGFRRCTPEGDMLVFTRRPPGRWS